MRAYNVVRDFEADVAEYTGAPYVVAVNSCTMALLLAVAWHLRDGEKNPLHPDWRGPKYVEIPKRTYLSVPMSIIYAGGRPTFRDQKWEGAYQLKPLPVWDSARWFSGNMYQLGAWNGSSPMVCVSFHASKTLGDTQGGAILHDNPEADAWLRRARFDGRTEGVAPIDDNITQVGWHCYLSPDVAARLLLKLHSLPHHNAPLPNDCYPDLSQIEAFK